MTVENKKDVVYFSVDNWFSGRDYPYDEYFIKWMRDDLNQYFRNEEWVKKMADTEDEKRLLELNDDVMHRLLSIKPHEWNG